MKKTLNCVWTRDAVWSTIFCHLFLVSPQHEADRDEPSPGLFLQRTFLRPCLRNYTTPAWHLAALLRHRRETILKSWKCVYVVERTGPCLLFMRLVFSGVMLAGRSIRNSGCCRTFKPAIVADYLVEMRFSPQTSQYWPIHDIATVQLFPVKARPETPSGSFVQMP